MFSRMMWACALAGLMPNTATAVAVLTYESYDDLTPGDPGIILGAPGMGSDSATIEIRLAPADGEPFLMAAAGYNFDGTDHGDGSVTSPDGGITSSDHHWAEVFEDTNLWFTIDPLPTPEVIAFFHAGEPVPLEGLLMGSLTVTANEIGAWLQPTNPVLLDDDLMPIPLTGESGFYTVTVLPEPTSATLMIGWALLALRRRHA